MDHLRVVYARAGRAHCPACKKPVEGQTPEEIVQSILREHAGQNEERVGGGRGELHGQAPTGRQPAQAR